MTNGINGTQQSTHILYAHNTLLIILLLHTKLRVWPKMGMQCTIVTDSWKIPKKDDVWTTAVVLTPFILHMPVFGHVFNEVWC